MEAVVSQSERPVDHHGSIGNKNKTQAPCSILAKQNDTTAEVANGLNSVGRERLDEGLMQYG